MPELDPAALHGLVGDVVERIQPEMEVTAGAVGVDLLCSLANAVGPGPKTLIGGYESSANFNVLKVGRTGVAKSFTGKPTDVILANQITWRERVLSDIATPDYLLGFISDTYRDGDETVERSQVEKQRLLRIDELEVVLNRSKNPEATLLQYMNYAFDGTPIEKGSLAAKERGNRSTGHFLSCITNTTPGVLQKHAELAATGYLNRFLLFWIEKRDVDIPSPKRVDLSALAKRASKVVTHWRDREVLVENDDAAEARWVEAYSSLNKPRPDNALGQMLVRGRVIVPRLSLAYAIADCSETITVEHLEAALALWDYHCQAAAELFPAKLSRFAERIIDHLEEHLSANKETLNKLCNNRTSACSQALIELLDLGLIESSTAKSGPKGGRPIEVWSIKR